MFKKSLICALIFLTISFIFLQFIYAETENIYYINGLNDPPDKPHIYGPDNGTINVKYTFCTDTITDPAGNSIYCFWDWDDGSNSGWLGPYTSGQVVCESHMWIEPGEYCIMLKLKDSSDLESQWSDPFCITIVDNQPPSAPLIDGPNHVRIGFENTWGFVSVDPEVDNITYYVDWGDVCGGAEYHGPYPSGKKINLSHTYTKKINLIINAMAIDSHGAESELSYFEVEITRNKKVVIQNIFSDLLNRLPNMLKIILNFLNKSL